MSDIEFNELSGRIEGVGRSFLLLTAMLEREGILNGPRYCETLRELANGLRFEAAHHRGLTTFAPFLPGNI